MNLVQDAYFYVNGADFLGVTTINARLTADDAATNNILLELFEGVFQIFF
jgi:hypothetical protein